MTGNPVGLEKTKNKNKTEEHVTLRQRSHTFLYLIRKHEWSIAIQLSTQNPYTVPVNHLIEP